MKGARGCGSDRGDQNIEICMYLSWWSSVLFDKVSNVEVRLVGLCDRKPKTSKWSHGRQNKQVEWNVVYDVELWGVGCGWMKLV